MKESYYSRSFTIVFLGIDLIVLNACFIIAYFTRFPGRPYITTEYLALILLFNIIWIISSLYSNIYLLSKLRSLRKSIAYETRTILIHILLISLCFVAFKAQEELSISRKFLIYFYPMCFIGIVVVRIFYAIIIKNYYERAFNIRRVLIVGSGSSAKQMFDYFQTEKSTIYQFVGFADNENEGDIDQSLIIGNVDEVNEICLKESVSEIYYAKSLTDINLINRLTDFADKNFIYLRFVPDFRGLQKSKFDITFYRDVPIVNYTRAPLGGYFNQRVKRMFDIVFSLSVICLIFPFVVPVIALLIKLESKGPIFFHQLRPGKANKLFDCLKFRTMKVNKSGEKQAVKNDPRITKIGNFLRKTSLDEFPQFINVLKGDMSIVGPRPNMISQLEFYSKEIDKYNFRHFITPGITGWAQINGFRGETERMELMEKRVEHDAWYIENWSLTLDVKIIILTAWKMLVGDDRAY